MKLKHTVIPIFEFATDCRQPYLEVAVSFISLGESISITDIYI